MKKTYIIPTIQVVQLNVHQPILTMSLNNTETPIQFSRELDPFAGELDPFSGEFGSLTNELDPFAGLLMP